MSFLDTQEFSIAEPPGIKMIAFVVNYTTSDKWKDLPVCMLEKLECSEVIEGGKKLKTFAIPTESKEIMNVIMLSLAKSKCVIGYGKVKENQFIPEENTIHINYTNVGEVEGDAKDFKFRYNSKRQMVLIDVESGEQVSPIISREEVNGAMFGKYKLIPYKNYIAMELALRPIPKKMSREDIANMII